MKEKSFAKVNLAINVIRKLPNGYHELDMIMLPISLYDEIEINFAPDDLLNGRSFNDVVVKNNLIVKTIELMRRKYDLVFNFDIQITKRIPLSAGLGGGSSNAATTIKILNKLCNLGLQLEEMSEIGQQLGADVPFFLYGQPARVRGIGNLISPLEIEPITLLLIKPLEGISTKEAFQKLNLNECNHPNIDQIIQNINDQKNWFNLLGNSLEYSANILLPKLEAIKQELFMSGIDKIIMSGSGSTLIFLASDEQILNKVLTKKDSRYDLFGKYKTLK